jgi:hypothetical protein
MQWTQHWLVIELRRSYRSLLNAPAQIWSATRPTRILRGMVRRVVWVSPRIPTGLVRRFGGPVLLCAFIAAGMRYWPKDSDAATAAVQTHAAIPNQVPAPPSQVPGTLAPPAQAGPSMSGASKASTTPAPRTTAELIAQRKANLARAQQKCMQQIELTEPYQAAKARFDELDARVRALRSEDPYRELPKVSVEWIQAKSDLQKVIDEAMRTDPDVVRAQDAMNQTRRFR